ncbi:MAG TPA: hypothetical protein VIU38_09195 [Anaerolineales bacterium]
MRKRKTGLHECAEQGNSSGKPATMNWNSAWIRLVIAFVAAAVSVRVLYNDVWASSTDLGLHYAMTRRIMELGAPPVVPDVSLGSMNGYPSLSHRIAAGVGEIMGSAFAGMQLTATMALALIWVSMGMFFGKVGGRLLPAMFISAPLALLVNRYALHLEVVGIEVVGNYFYPQVVAQAVALGALALALHLDEAGASPKVRNLVLGGLAPVIAEMHPLPALEILLVLILRSAWDLIQLPRSSRWRESAFGIMTAIVSATLIVTSSSFQVVRQVSENDGGISLRYTTEPWQLVVESAIVLALALVLLDRARPRGDTGFRPKQTAHVYWAFLGMGSAALCVLQFLLLQFGFASPYAVKKYVFILNTVLLLDLPLLVTSLWAMHGNESAGSSAPIGSALRTIFPAIFVLACLFTFWPAATERTASVEEILPIERFALEHRAQTPGGNAGRYDYALGLLRDFRSLDFMISIGALRAPETKTVEDLTYGRPVSSPRRIGRIFTRQGSAPWDVPGCRQLAIDDGFAILNGKCVLEAIQLPVR